MYMRQLHREGICFDVQKKKLYTRIYRAQIKTYTYTIGVGNVIGFCNLFKKKIWTFTEYHSYGRYLGLVQFSIMFFSTSIYPAVNFLFVRLTYLILFCFCNTNKEYLFYIGYI